MSQKSAVKSSSRVPRAGGLWILLLVLGGVLAALFWRSFAPAWVLFANDGPLGATMAERSQVPETFTGGWSDLNGYGSRDPGASPNITFGLLWVLGPLGFAKFYAPITLLFLGTSAWFFIRQLGLGPAASLLGGLAAALMPDFFCDASWGTGPHLLCYGSNYFALGLVVSRQNIPHWVRYPLAGLAVGMGIMEGADIGAMFSVFTALFVVFHALVTSQRPVMGIVHGGLRVVTIAVFAAIIAAATLYSLIGTQIKGVVGTQQDKQTKEEQWDRATWGSFSISDLPGLIVPGVYGYRMMGFDEGQPPEQVFWGRTGRGASWDRYFASGKQGPPPQDIIRWGSGGGYVGVFIFITACWALLQSFRKEKSLFSGVERKHVWFWAATALVAMLLSFGRYAPFYQLVYALPYASAVRIPAKFMHVLNWSLVVMFAYGLSGLSRHCMDSSAPGTRDIFSQWRAWWSKATVFDKRWVKLSWLVFVTCVVGWIGYSSSRTWLMNYLQEVFFEAGHANAIASFSFKQVGIFLVFLAVALGLFTLVLSGYFTGRRAMFGVLLIGLFVFVDLSRVGKRWVVTYNWKDRYLKAADNEVIRFLQKNSKQGRVASLPAPTNEANWVFRKEWLEHIFQYYNIQSLDIIQMPRVPEDVAAFERASGYDGNPANLYKIGRHWQLTNTRYLIGPAAAYSELNNKVDPGQHRFQPRLIFELQQLYERGPALVYTNALRQDRLQFALFEFTGALPRAKLYSNWQVSINDDTALTQLASKEFNPQQTVLVSEPLPAPKEGATNSPVGTVEFKSYAPKRIVLQAKATSPSVLLLNDKHDPNWLVVVDGKPAPLLRCNFIMRGVFLDPGEHTVEFLFRPPVDALYISLGAIALGLVLLGFAFENGRRSTSRPDPESKPA